MKKTTSKRKASAKKPRKKTVAKKQSELEQLNLMDGKLEVDKVRELEELLGVDQTTVFKTNDLEVGEQKPIIDPNDPQFDKVKKLMSEGF